jgi:hypothetical protein
MLFDAAVVAVVAVVFEDADISDLAATLKNVC